MLECLVEDAWNTGRPGVVVVDLSPAVIGRRDVMAVLTDAREEFRAIGGRLDAVAGRR
jgi:hypothetical protein